MADTVLIDFAAKSQHREWEREREGEREQAYPSIDCAGIMKTIFKLKQLMPQAAAAAAAAKGNVPQTLPQNSQHENH